MVINTNVLALNAHRAMKGVGTLQMSASARLSSGLKINTAADDAAGLAISEKMRSQIRGLDMASKNAQDAISLIQTSEGGMAVVDDILQRMRELAVNAANDTNEWEMKSGADRRKLQDEFDALAAEIDSMAGRVEFNKKRTINGDYSVRAQDSDTQNWLKQATTELADAKQAYIKSKDELTLAMNDIRYSGLGDTAGDSDNSGIAGAISAIKNTVDYRTNANVQKLVDDMLSEFGRQIDVIRGADDLTISVDGVNTELGNALKYLQEDGTPGTDIVGVDWALALSKLTVDNGYSQELQTAMQTFTNVISDGGANSIQAKVAAIVDDSESRTEFDIGGYEDIKDGNPTLNILKQAQANYARAKVAFDSSVQWEGVEAANGSGAPKADNLANNKIEGLFFQVGANANQKIEISIGSFNTNALGVGDGRGRTDIDFIKASGRDITNYISQLDDALTYVTTERSKLGATQNRLEYTIKSLDISSENLSASESRIRDTDMAKEMMNLTKANVLQQAATSMLAQANQAPNSVLQLLN